MKQIKAKDLIVGMAFENGSCPVRVDEIKKVYSHQGVDMLLIKCNYLHEFVRVKANQVLTLVTFN